MESGSHLFGYRRLRIRHAVNIGAKLRVHGLTLQTEVLDLSAAGCRFYTLMALAPGTRVVLTLPGFEPMGGTVRWKQGDHCGASFDRPMHQAVFEAIAKRYG